MRTFILFSLFMFACAGDDDGPPLGATPDAGMGSGSACVPQCGDRECGLDPVCGTVCGTCEDGMCTAAGTCESVSTCVPKTCAQLGAECGVVDNGCGQSLSCGTCGAGETCGALQLNKCDPGACTPRTCLSVGAECGTIDNGCGSPLACGTCTGGEICGAGGQANVCSPPPATWSKLSTGAFHTCGVKNDGTLWCWGRNNAGQLGLGTTGGTITTPQRVGVSFGWTEIAAGGFHTCGINYDHLYCWGDNASNQLGDGTTNDAATPRLIEGAKMWNSVVAGWNTACARSGDQYCWGNNDYQALSTQLGPVATPRYVGDFYTEMALGGGHACYRREGVVAVYLSCGGLNTSGQLGINSAAQSAPRSTVWGEREWSAIYGGGAHTCAFANVGTLFCWGSNQYGQLGNPGAPEIIPDYVDGLTDWKTMGLGDAHTCGVKLNGNLYCWGLNDEGQVGDGTMTNRTQPVLIGSMFASVSGGYAHTCALDSSSGLWCWGDNSYGQLGTGAASTTTPTAVP